MDAARSGAPLKKAQMLFHQRQQMQMGNPSMGPSRDANRPPSFNRGGTFGDRSAPAPGARQGPPTSMNDLSRMMSTTQLRPKAPPTATKHHGDNRDPATAKYFDHAGGQRINTDVFMTKALKEEYPHLEVVTVPSWSVDLFSYAFSGHATVTTLSDDSPLPSSLQWTMFIPPSRRKYGDTGILVEMPLFGKYLYKWNNSEFIVYLADGRDGMEPWPVTNLYVLTTDPYKVDSLLLAAGSWQNQLVGEILVFDEGYWSRSRELWESIQRSRWEDVILDKDMKKALIEDHNSFFDSQEKYEKLKVPWKRGLIYHGPPGNGKTISIKATANMLSKRDPTVPTLYVRTLRSWNGPEYSVKMIFEKAREFAPCYLVFEDIDTIIDDEVRSYFLNEVDGLKDNDGIFIIASTNHLDKLDPGIAKRPSRFDRKYFFPDPNVDQREAYCQYWQRKLADNKDIEFPDKLCRAIAEITDKFSFAYIQEAFVAALLSLARDDPSSPSGSGAEEAWVDVGAMKVRGDDLDKLPLWKAIKKQVKILREGIEEDDE